MRVLPYFQSVFPKRSVGPTRAKPGPGSIDRQLAPDPPGKAQPLKDKFVPISLATGIVHSIKHDPKIAMNGTAGEPGELRQASGIVKSGMYILYRLDGKVDDKPAPNRGENLDLSG